MQDELLQRLGKAKLLSPSFAEEFEAAPTPVGPGDDEDHEDEDDDEDDGRGFTLLGPSPGAKKRKRTIPPHLRLLRLCDQRVLEGGLSISLDVRADELVGPLCSAIGGTAPRLRVLDVRERPVFELRIAWGTIEEPWEIEDLYGFVHNLNDLFKDDRSARAVAVLGEWQDSLQLWCVKKEQLPWLLRQDFFAPHNRHQLEQLTSSQRRQRDD